MKVEHKKTCSCKDCIEAALRFTEAMLKTQEKKESEDKKT